MQSLGTFSYKDAQVKSAHVQYLRFILVSVRPRAELRRTGSVPGGRVPRPCAQAVRTVAQRAAPWLGRAGGREEEEAAEAQTRFQRRPTLSLPPTFSPELG